jgi:hypothetical protein
MKGFSRGKGKYSTELRKRSELAELRIRLNRVKGKIISITKGKEVASQREKS